MLFRSKLTGQNKEVAAGLLTQAKRDEAAERRTRIEAESGERRTAMMANAEMAKAKVMQDQNLFYKQQQSINMAADNAENALKNYAAANKLNLLQMQQQDPNAYNRLREYFRREAFAAAGLEYKPANIANPSLSADDEALMIDLGKALAAFQETLVTGRTPFDDFRDAVARNDWKTAAAYPANALRGARIFMGKGNCSLCHFGPAFTNGEFHEIGIPIVKKASGVDRKSTRLNSSHRT